MKTKLIGGLLTAICSVSQAYFTPYELIMAASCNHHLNPAFYNQEFTHQYGKPFKHEGEALWFHASGELYGSPIREVFVSTSREYHFVGLVLEDSPPIIIERMKTSRVIPTNVFNVGANGWVGADNRQIMWHAGKFTKIFCMSGFMRSIER
jgi:hypothetical protein